LGPAGGHGVIELVTLLRKHRLLLHLEVFQPVLSLLLLLQSEALGGLGGLRACMHSGDLGCVFLLRHLHHALELGELLLHAGKPRLQAQDLGVLLREGGSQVARGGLLGAGCLDLPRVMVVYVAAAHAHAHRRARRRSERRR
jgi:hypothetical protein